MHSNDVDAWGEDRECKVQGTRRTKSSVRRKWYPHGQIHSSSHLRPLAPKSHDTVIVHHNIPLAVNSNIRRNPGGPRIENQKDEWTIIWFTFGLVQIIGKRSTSKDSLVRNDPSSSQFQSPIRECSGWIIKDIGANLYRSVSHVLHTNCLILVYEVTNLYLRRRIEKSTFRRFSVA